MLNGAYKNTENVLRIHFERELEGQIPVRVERKVWFGQYYETCVISVCVLPSQWLLIKVRDDTKTEEVVNNQEPKIQRPLAHTAICAKEAMNGWDIILGERCQCCLWGKRHVAQTGARPGNTSQYFITKTSEHSLGSWQITDGRGAVVEVMPKRPMCSVDVWTQAEAGKSHCSCNWNLMQFLTGIPRLVLMEMLQIGCWLIRKSLRKSHTNH